MTRIEYIDAGQQAVKDSEKWARCTAHKCSEEEFKAYAAGVAEGWREAGRHLTLHGALKFTGR